MVYGLDGFRLLSVAARPSSANAILSVPPSAWQATAVDLICQYAAGILHEQQPVCAVMQDLTCVWFVVPTNLCVPQKAMFTLFAVWLATAQDRSQALKGRGRHQLHTQHIALNKVCS